MARPLGPMTAQMENFIRAEARGEPHSQILQEIFHVDPGDTPAKLKAEQKMCRWRHRPDADAIWQDELKATVRRRVPAAVQRINTQVDADKDWLANKAANDVLLLAAKVGVIKSEDTALQVQITGMPEIGTPDENA